MKPDVMRNVGVAMFKAGYRFISQKWFQGDREVFDINYEIQKAARINCFDNELDRIKEIIRNSSPLAEQKGLWPPIEWPEKEGVLPFPLEKKQLVLINRMLFHPMDNNGRNIIITTGIGGSGKSTFLNIIKQLHNNDCGAATIGDLANEFIRANVVGHRLICSDEIGAKDLDSDVLKRMATKDDLEINPKYAHTYQIRSQANLFWCCNQVPVLDIKDSGLLRRIVFYERNTRIENPDPSKAKQVFTKDELSIIATEAKKYEDDHWFENNFEHDTKKYLIRNTSVGQLWTDDYTDYKIKCMEDGANPFKRSNWQEIKAVIEEWVEKDPNLTKELGTSRCRK